jgi:hypothetical protein
MKKSELLQNALLMVSGLFSKYESMGSKIDTGEADYKGVAQAVAAALSAPEDAVPLPEIIVPPAPSVTPEQLQAGLSSVAEKISGEYLHHLDTFKDDVAGAITEAMRELLAEVEAKGAAATQETPVAAV